MTMLGTYFQGRVTPDGPMVTRHDPPDFAGVTLPWHSYDWGKESFWAEQLAYDLIEETIGVPPRPCLVMGLADEHIKRFPAGGEWRLTAQEIVESLKRNDNPF